MPARDILRGCAASKHLIRLLYHGFDLGETLAHGASKHRFEQGCEQADWPVYFCGRVQLEVRVSGIDSGKAAGHDQDERTNDAARRQQTIWFEGSHLKAPRALLPDDLRCAAHRNWTRRQRDDLGNSRVSFRMVLEVLCGYKLEYLRHRTINNGVDINVLHV